MNTTMIRQAFIALCVVMFVGCANNGRFVQGSDGTTLYELPKASSNEEHCHGAGVFSKQIAQQRFFTGIREGKEFVIPNSKESARKDLDAELAGVATFTEEGKRNRDKILELFERIMTQEFVDKTPEQVGQTIHDECMQKMADGTWFKSPS